MRRETIELKSGIDSQERFKMKFSPIMEKEIETVLDFWDGNWCVLLELYKFPSAAALSQANIS